MLQDSSQPSPARPIGAHVFWGADTADTEDATAA